MINKGYRILLPEMDGSWINWIPNWNFVTLASTIFLVHTTNLKTFLLNGKKYTSLLHQPVLDLHHIMHVIFKPVQWSCTVEQLETPNLTLTGRWWQLDSWAHSITELDTMKLQLFSFRLRLCFSVHTVCYCCMYCIKTNNNKCDLWLYPHPVGSDKWRW